MFCYGTPTTTPLTSLNICTCFNWSASSSGQTSCESCATAWGFCRLCVPNWGVAPALRALGVLTHMAPAAPLQTRLGFEIVFLMMLRNPVSQFPYVSTGGEARGIWDTQGHLSPVWLMVIRRPFWRHWFSLLNTTGFLVQASFPSFSTSFTTLSTSSWKLSKKRAWNMSKIGNSPMEVSYHLYQGKASREGRRLGFQVQLVDSITLEPFALLPSFIVLLFSLFSLFGLFGLFSLFSLFSLPWRQCGRPCPTSAARSAKQVYIPKLTHYPIQSPLLSYIFLHNCYISHVG